MRGWGCADSVSIGVEHNVYRAVVVIGCYIKFTSGQAFIVTTVQIFMKRYKYNVAMLITSQQPHNITYKQNSART